MVRHIGLVLTGRLRLRMDDGAEIEIGPDDVFDIPPGHDAWVIGDEPWVTIEVAGIYGFGRPARGGPAYVTSILITDIVDSTAIHARLGAAEWSRLVESHFEQSRRVLDRFQGLLVKTTGDGVIATFDGAARAARAAAEMHTYAEHLGLRLRAGIHTGEVENVPGDIRGLAVHIAARVAAEAGPAETLVTATTRDVVSAEDLAFEPRGARELKGIEGARELYAVDVRTQ